MMNRRPRGPSPAFVVALVALFVGLGGGAAMASGLLSGKQIVNHSIAEKKLTAAAVKALQGQPGPRGQTGDTGATGPKGDTGPQGPGAISVSVGNAPVDTTSHLLATVHGVEVMYFCGSDVGFFLVPKSSTDVIFASGDMALNGTLTSVQRSGDSIVVGDTSTVDLDLIAWAGSDGTLSRFDLGAYHGAGGCNIWGLITPGSS